MLRNFYFALVNQFICRATKLQCHHSKVELSTGEKQSCCHFDMISCSFCLKLPHTHTPQKAVNVQHCVHSVFNKHSADLGFVSTIKLGLPFNAVIHDLIDLYLFYLFVSHNLREREERKAMLGGKQKNAGCAK